MENKLSFLKDQTPPGTVSAVKQVIDLLRGWYRNFQPGADELTSWSFLLKSCDSSLFLPAAELWSQEHPEWPPNAPEFQQVVERLAYEREKEEVRQANMRLIETSKAKALRYGNANQRTGQGVYVVNGTGNSADGLRIDLTRAFRENQLTLAYQPIVDMESRQAVAAEALIRWDHPERGALLPDEFIPAFEQTGLVVPIGTWVTEQACEQLAKWTIDGVVDDAFVMHVNVSRAQLFSDQVVTDFRSALEHYQVKAERVCVEITETALVDFQTAEGTIRKLSDLGLHLAVDDFGTGYSSLSMLTGEALFDVLKIDKVFMDQIGTAGGAILAETIITLAKRLGITAIGEGVETEDQAVKLLEFGCRLGQGHLFGKAVPGEEFAKAVLRDTRLTDSERAEYRSYDPPF